MASFMKEYEHLKIQLKEIISATNNFDENKVIGNGGFGKVYEGELCHSNPTKKSLVAFKRLDRKYGQGDPQFWKEIMMLSQKRHMNLISLLGFCIEEGEMILVYEYASRGSLERYLNDVTLTWTQRIKICIDAANGLSFLHEPNERQQRVLHCDVKSANILLDDNLNAKVSDFGLSKIGSTAQQYSVVITNAVGTPGYCDPLYMETYQLTKESDVYSFGVVLFEVLCGRQCVECSNGQLKVHVPFWKKSYEDKKLDAIVFQGLMQQMNPDSLEAFADIAYQCLQKSREQRPTMSVVVEQLNFALELQGDQHTFGKYREIIKASVDPLIFTSLDQLKALLSKGVFLNGGKSWFALNEKGEHIERICIETCFNPNEIEKRDLQLPPDDIVNSRFPGRRCYKYRSDFKARVRGQYLTSKISYTLNLVFRYSWNHRFPTYNPLRYKPLRYKVDGEETKVFITYPSDKREDGWFIAPLYQFTSQNTSADLQFIFEECWRDLQVAGIEFQPSQEKAELQEYQDVVQVASQPLLYTSVDELKQILSKGVYLNRYKTWFSLNKKGEHCKMISIEDCLIPNQDYPSQYESHSWSRFPAGLYQTNKKGFKTHVNTQLLSPSIPYTINLVFWAILSTRPAYVDLKYRLKGETTTSTVYLANVGDDEFHMAELYQFTSDGSIVDLEIDFDDHGTNLRVEGILFQPLEIVEDQVSKEDNVENNQTISDLESDTFWEQKLPNDYDKILNLSKDSLQWTTKKELYSILKRGFLINNGHQWLSVDKSGKKCLTLSVRATWVIDDKNSAYESSNEPRFREVRVITAGDKFEIKEEINSGVLSPETNYASYLVYKLPQDQSIFEVPLNLNTGNGCSDRWYIYLGSLLHTPVIGPNLGENSYRTLNRHKLNVVPRHRSDGWMEVKVRQFETKETPKTVSMHLQLNHPCKKDLSGLRVLGIELRPI